MALLAKLVKTSFKILFLGEVKIYFLLQSRSVAASNNVIKLGVRLGQRLIAVLNSVLVGHIRVYILLP